MPIMVGGASIAANLASVTGTLTADEVTYRGRMIVAAFTQRGLVKTLLWNAYADITETHSWRKSRMDAVEDAYECGICSQREYESYRAEYDAWLLGRGGSVWPFAVARTVHHAE